MARASSNGWKPSSIRNGDERFRQIFNETDKEVLWLIVGTPEELEFLPTATTKPDMSLIYPTDPKLMPKELDGISWLPEE